MLKTIVLYLSIILIVVTSIYNRNVLRYQKGSPLSKNHKSKERQCNGQAKKDKQ